MEGKEDAMQKSDTKRKLRSFVGFVFGILSLFSNSHQPSRQL